MPRFSVPEMSCGHCTAAIEKQLKAADASSRVVCDLSDRTVTVDSSLETEAVIAAMQQAGYEAIRL